MLPVLQGARDLCVATYDIGVLTLESAGFAGYAIRRQNILFKQFYEVGNRSLFIITVFGLFVGLILVLYGGDQLQRFNQEKYIGLTGVAMVWEFGPVFTAILLAGRIGSSYAAEIGTMQVYDEIDALRSMGVRPEAYLAAPRLLACSLLLPLLVTYADFTALAGGAGMGWVSLHVSPSEFYRVFFQYLRFRDMWRSLIKALIFGGIVAMVGCYHGFKTTGGAEGVGRSTTESVVHSLLAILVADYFINKVLLALD